MLGEGARSAIGRKAREVVGTDWFVAVEAASLPSDSSEAAEAICRLLEEGGFIPELGDLTGGAGI